MSQILLGRGQQIFEMPESEWQQQLAQVPQHAQTRLRFMSLQHHRVREFVVKELPRVGKAIEPDNIARRLNLPLSQVNLILDELERHLFFLVRNLQGAVSWAFPVTVDATPHTLHFNSGERLYGA